MSFDDYEWSGNNPLDINFVSPQSLMLTNQPEISSMVIDKTNMFKACLLVPGGRYCLSLINKPVPTAATIINGEHEANMRAYQENLEYVVIVPRLPQNSHITFTDTIVFSVKGKPGIYLHKLDTVRIDHPDDPVFKDRGWKRTRVEIDWPGVERIGRLSNLPCSPGQGFYTRQEVALEVGRQVREVLLPHTVVKHNYSCQALNKRNRLWDIRHIDYRSVRLLGINYYQNWVPVLAIDDPDNAIGARL
ncbi:hypothetical protein JR316_0002940 [Psilocybe cubensis]|uniref:Uncharacterized protein n=2 Tax=Psilocybe cubensis TaxID=181762 RepID=A0ACB8H715_PSICU|nr:hypothetical protein JR316_0002940 [Psilocybe cubensis]KAH9483472.1 hypothetical protein JR316_0002940 [Psilocybe cubensis]